MWRTHRGAVGFKPRQGYLAYENPAGRSVGFSHDSHQTPSVRPSFSNSRCLPYYTLYPLKLSDMTSGSPPSPNLDHHTGERRRVPANTYYVMPYLAHFFFIFAITGSIGCAQLDKHLSSAEAAILWTVFGISCLLLASLSPALYVERKTTNEEGREITLRCQLVGLKAFEVNLDMEGIEKGRYDPPDGDADPRLHDGCRHGPALLRI